MKMWDGRFSKQTDRIMESFNNSLPFDRELFAQDIALNMAWARALKTAGVFSAAECKRVLNALKSIGEEYRAGTIAFTAADEDVHMAVERLLTQRIGKAGGRIHTGRSRNDQVATDIRLYIKDACKDLVAGVAALQKALLKRAMNDEPVIMPGYTHLQQAQPILLSHYWLSFLFALERDKKRLLLAAESADCMPLGSGAIAGAGIRVNRTALAADLGFSSITDNSIDGVAARDGVLETLAAIVSLSITLSRYAADMITFSSREFGFFELDDAWSTGSSMMPQKKNPDSLELIRGKCGRFIGNYTRLATTLKGLGLAYYKDLQEDKEPLFDSVKQISLVLLVFNGVISTLTVNRGRIESNLDPLLLATDIADYLVGRGLPFRQAHSVVGKLVAWSIENKTAITGLTVEQFKKFSPLFGNDIVKILNWEAAIAHRSVAGGTSRKSVQAQIKKAQRLCK